MPEFRSGAYALLITLYKNEDSSQVEDETTNYMLKNQLIKDAQKHCDSKFVSTDPKNHYTAWNSMSNLIKKSMVDKDNKLPARYRLTEEGRTVARRILHGESSTTMDKNNSDSDSDSYHEEFSKSSKVSKLSSEATKTRKDNVKDDCIEILDSDSLDSDIVPVTKTKKIDMSKNKCSSSNKYDSSDDDVLEELTTYKRTEIQVDTEHSTGLSQEFSYSSIQATNSSGQSTQTKIMRSFESTGPSVLATLQPGTFDIILFVDNCEQSHA